MTDYGNAKNFPSNSIQFSGTASIPDTGATEIVELLLFGDRPVVGVEIVGPVTAGTVTITGFYKMHSAGDWTAIPARMGTVPGTVAHDAVERFWLNTEGVYAIRFLGQMDSGTKSITARGTAGDKAPGISYNATINADVVNADMNAITGTSPNNATLYDVDTHIQMIGSDIVGAVGSPSQEGESAAAMFPTPVSDEIANPISVTTSRAALTLVSGGRYRATANNAKVYIVDEDAVVGDNLIAVCYPTCMVEFTAPQATVYHYGTAATDMEVIRV